MVPKYVYEAMVETHHRELDIYYTTLNERLRAQEQHHQADLHNLTQAPVYYTKSGRCWHADPQCLRRFATQDIQQKNYCTLCSHTLGGILTPGIWDG